jgi:hypothetical protein
LSETHLGAAGLNPTSETVVLDPTDPNMHGIAQHTAGVDSGVWIGWDFATEEWHVSVSWPSFIDRMFEFTSPQPFASVTPVGFDSATERNVDRDRYFVGDGDGFTEMLGVGFGQYWHSVAGVGVDFDNDMDLDLYLVRSTATENPANVLFENLGDGTFQQVFAMGAEGSSRGLGDSVISLDYDRDGRVDLFTVNGRGDYFDPPGRPRAFSDDGPVQLFRNVTNNDNHWLSVELLGTTSNRSGIGARIEVTVGGVTQVRERTDGVHVYSQNNGVHFGLGSHANIDRIDVFWPSGQTTVLTDVPADQAIVISE